MKLFPYQKKLIALNISLLRYKEIQEYLKNKNVDLNHCYRKGFRLFRWLEQGKAGYSVCWLSDVSMQGLFDNPELFLQSLGD
jgi:hypothetical protein